MLQPDGFMATKSLSELGVKEQSSRERLQKIKAADRKKIIPVIRAVHEVKRKDMSMKILDHNYYVQDNWDDYDLEEEGIIEMICRKISDILH